MTPIVEKLLAEFEALPEARRQKVIFALLRRVRTETHDPPADRDLVTAADGIFQVQNLITVPHAKLLPVLGKREYLTLGRFSVFAGL